MNFQFLPTAGLLPQGAVPIYGTTGTSSLLGPMVGARSLLGASPGQLPLLAAQGGGMTVSNQVSQAALLQGMRPQLGGASLAAGQAMLTTVPPPGTRFLVPPTSQAMVAAGVPPMYMMQSLSGSGMMSAIDASALMASGQDEEAVTSAAGGTPRLEGADESQSNDVLLGHPSGLTLATAAGRTMLSQSLLMAQPPGSHPMMLAHPQSLQEPPPFMPPGLLGHGGFSAYPGLSAAQMAAFAGMAAHQGLAGQQDYSQGSSSQQMAQSQDQQQGQGQSDQQGGQSMGSQMNPAWSDASGQQYAAQADDRFHSGMRDMSGQQQHSRFHQEQQQPAPYVGEREQDPDEPVVDFDRTVLDFFNSDLHLEIAKDGYTAEALTKPVGFCFCWAGARATYGVCSGKVCFEVLILEHLEVDFGEDHQETDPHIMRIGWSMDSTSFQLGEEDNSYGYGGTGKFSTNNKFSNYGKRFQKGDVVMGMVDFESRPPKISFAVNGQWLGVASPLHGYKVGSREHALFPHVLSKNCRFEVNFGQREPWYPPPLPGFVFIDHLPLQNRVRGMIAPARKIDCEMIMIVGLPGSGKTTWAQNMVKQHAIKRYNVIGTDTLIDKMRVMGLPRRSNYHGRWEVLIQKATNCLNKLFQIASRRKRNYILDQTNVYASARKRKMRHFINFRRICAVIQPEDEELKRREWKRTFEDGKVVPEEAVLEMKFNYSLPSEADQHVDEIMWVELPRDKSEELVQSYVSEAREKLPPRDPGQTFGQQGFNSFQQQQQQQPWQDQGGRFSMQPQGDQSGYTPAEKRMRVDHPSALDYIKHEYEEHHQQTSDMTRKQPAAAPLPPKQEIPRPPPEPYGQDQYSGYGDQQQPNRFSAAGQQQSNYWDGGQDPYGSSANQWGSQQTASTGIKTEFGSGFQNAGNSQQRGDTSTGYRGGDVSTGQDAAGYTVGNDQGQSANDDYYAKWNEWSQAYSQATGTQAPPAMPPPPSSSATGYAAGTGMQSSGYQQDPGTWGYPPPLIPKMEPRPPPPSAAPRLPGFSPDVPPPPLRPPSGMVPPTSSTSSGMTPSGPPPPVPLLGLTTRMPAGFQPPSGLRPPGGLATGPPPPRATGPGAFGQQQSSAGYGAQNWGDRSGGEPAETNQENLDRQGVGSGGRFGQQQQQGQGDRFGGAGNRTFSDDRQNERFGGNQDRGGRDMDRGHEPWRDREQGGRDQGRDRDRDSGRDFVRGERDQWRGDRGRQGRDQDGGRFRDQGRGDRDSRDFSRDSRGGRDDRDGGRYDRGPGRGDRDRDSRNRDQPSRDRDVSRDRNRDRDHDSNRDSSRDHDRDRDRGGKDREREADRSTNRPEPQEPPRTIQPTQPKRPSRWGPGPEEEVKPPVVTDVKTVTSSAPSLLTSPAKPATPVVSVAVKVEISEPLQPKESTSILGPPPVSLASSSSPAPKSSPVAPASQTSAPTASPVPIMSLMATPIAKPGQAPPLVPSFRPKAPIKVEPEVEPKVEPGVGEIKTETEEIPADVGEDNDNLGESSNFSGENEFDNSASGGGFEEMSFGPRPLMFRGGPRPMGGPPRNRFGGPPRGPPPPPRGAVPPYRMPFGGPPMPPRGRGGPVFGGGPPPRMPPGGMPPGMRGPPRWPRGGPPRPFR